MDITKGKYEPVIGIEVHVQVLTRTKMYCGCLASFGESPNRFTCPVCLGLPGSLPVVNENAVLQALKVAMALNCQINESTQFARKNYFYPDLPKGYQISQYDCPVGIDGYIEIYHENETKRIGIQRVHLEEDTAKLFHQPDGMSYIDYNRAGIPLMEIVSKPEIDSPDEARAYLVELRGLLRNLGASTGNMEEGSLRCEPNISIRPKGSVELHTKTELKNINSFSHVVKGIQFELERQASIVEEQGWNALKPETRGFNVKDNSTFPMRIKERPDEYRYFPEPDLPKMRFERLLIEEIQKDLAEPPLKIKKRLIEKYQIDYYQANLLVENNMMTFFIDTVNLGADPSKVANWITTEIFRILNEKQVDISNSLLRTFHLKELIQLVENGEISFVSAKEVLKEIFENGKSPSEIVIEKGYIQISRDEDIEPIVQSILNENKEIVERYINGEEKLLGVLIGDIMKAFQGKGNPQKIREILLNRLNTLKG